MPSSSELEEIYEFSPYINIVRTALKEEGKKDKADELYDDLLLGGISLDAF